jgi:hypothetical protein
MFLLPHLSCCGARGRVRRLEIDGKEIIKPTFSWTGGDLITADVQLTKGNTISWCICCDMVDGVHRDWEFISGNQTAR